LWNEELSFLEYLGGFAVETNKSGEELQGTPFKENWFPDFLRPLLEAQFTTAYRLESV